MIKNAKRSLASERIILISPVVLGCRQGANPWMDSALREPHWLIMCSWISECQTPAAILILSSVWIIIFHSKYLFYFYIFSNIFVFSLIVFKEDQKNHIVQCHLEFWRKMAHNYGDFMIISLCLVIQDRAEEARIVGRQSWLDFW